MKLVHLGFTELEIHDGFFVGRTNSHEHITLEQHLAVMNEVKRHMTPPFAFILDEVNSYSVDLETMSYIRHDPDVLCISAVYYRLRTHIALLAASKFVKKPTAFFTSLDEAVDWSQEQLAKVKPKPGGS